MITNYSPEELKEIVFRKKQISAQEKLRYISSLRSRMEVTRVLDILTLVLSTAEIKNKILIPYVEDTLTLLDILYLVNESLGVEWGKGVLPISPESSLLSNHHFFWAPYAHVRKQAKKILDLKLTKSHCNPDATYYVISGNKECFDKYVKFIKCHLIKLVGLNASWAHEFFPESVLVEHWEQGKSICITSGDVNLTKLTPGTLKNNKAVRKKRKDK